MGKIFTVFFFCCSVAKSCPTFCNPMDSSCPFYVLLGASLMAQLVNDPPAMQETCARSLGGEDPLEKEMATHFNILAWEIPWTEEPGGLQSTGLQKIRHDLASKQ